MGVQARVGGEGDRDVMRLESQQRRPEQRAYVVNTDFGYCSERDGSP